MLEFVPRIALAKTSLAYQLEMMALIAQIHDTGGELWSSIGLRLPPLESAGFIHCQSSSKTKPQ